MRFLPGIFQKKTITLRCLGDWDSVGFLGEKLSSVFFRCHQEISGTKKKGGTVSTLIAGCFGGWGFPYIRGIHTAYIVISILGT